MAQHFGTFSPAQKVTAYLRTFADIPFAADIAELVGARRAGEEVARRHGLTLEGLTDHAPMDEARYKSIAAWLRGSGLRQVLELGAGLSPRGMALTADPHLTYIETDRREVADVKRELLNSIVRRRRVLPRDNLRVMAADALEPADLHAAARKFRPREPLAIVHEGLLPFLSSGETERVARNIHALLGEFGGAWVTPDFTLKGDEAAAAGRERSFQIIMAEASDRTIYNNAFDSMEHLRDYYRALGFQVEVFSQLYLATILASPARLRLPADVLEEARPRLRLWVLKRS
jgi:O-methyltransferase involved in polyketide biosynthesis